MRIIRGAALAAALISTMPAVAPAQPAPAAVGRTLESAAIIEAVDQRERSVILRNAEGELTTLFLGDRVRNLPQVKAGDKVVVRVTRAVAVAIDKADGRPPAAAGDAVETAPAGALPGAVYVRAVRVLVTFDSYDRATNIVTFTGPQGAQRTAELRDPKIRGFARRLRAGDKVQVAIVEGLAIGVVR